MCVSIDKTDDILTMDTFALRQQPPANNGQMSVATNVLLAAECDYYMCFHQYCASATVLCDRKSLPY